MAGLRASTLLPRTGNLKGRAGLKMSCFKLNNGLRLSVGYPGSEVRRVSVQPVNTYTEHT